MASAVAHCTVQPPSGQSTRQVLVPRHFAVEPPASTRLQVLPPSQVTPESAPAVSVQSLVPAQVAVELTPISCVHVLIAVQADSQFAPQVPVQVVLFAQREVQSVPQVTVQVLFLLQSNSMLFGGPASTPPSAEPPSVHVDPPAQLQLESVHAQSPVHVTTGGLGALHASGVSTITESRRAPRMGRGEQQFVCRLELLGRTRPAPTWVYRLVQLIVPLRSLRESALFRSACCPRHALCSHCGACVGSLCSARCWCCSRS
jgi:hypothetical protein